MDDETRRWAPIRPGMQEPVARQPVASSVRWNPPERVRHDQTAPAAAQYTGAARPEWAAPPVSPVVPPARRPAPVRPSSPPHASREAQRNLIDTWKWRASVVAGLAFAGFWVLAFGHPVGTAAQDPAAQGSTPQSNANQPLNVSQPTANPYFNRGNRGQSGGFAGQGNSGGLGAGYQPPVLNGRSS